MVGTHGRQPRRFPAVGALDRSGGLTTRLIWPEVEGPVPLAALDALARDTAYLGHSSSLTRCRFLEGAAEQDGMPARRRIYPRRLEELERAFSESRRPSPGESMHEAPPKVKRRCSLFGEDWLVLALDESADVARANPPDLRGAPLLAKLIRDVLMTGYGEAGPPMWISGHAADGAPSSEPHLAVLPLANVGWAHSDGALHGFALVPPRGMKLLEDAAFRKALAAVAPYDRDRRSRTLTLQGQRLSDASGQPGARLALRFGGETSGLRSLDTSRYTAVATTWASATPVVLERHLKAESPDARRAEIEDLIARACANIGLPSPEVIAGAGRPERRAILTDKHSAIPGAPATAPSGRGPSWLKWRMPKAFASRTLVHCVLRFPEPVRGPVVLGAGRFVGLGVCLPLDRKAGML